MVPCIWILVPTLLLRRYIVQDLGYQVLVSCHHRLPSAARSF